MAIIVACVAVKNRHGTLFDPKSAPILSFAPCALSNTFSSWSQYNALKFVTFPVQTIFKSSKIIPVMLMGRFLKGTMYGPKVCGGERGRAHIKETTPWRAALLK